MKYFRLVLAQLFAKKTRTILTLLSLTMAFLLFGLLQAVNVAFNSAGTSTGAQRLITQARVSFTQALPIRLLPQIEAVPGIAAVMYQAWFGAYFKDPRIPVPAFAVDPARLRAVDDRWTLADAHWRDFENTRTGMIAGRKLAEKEGWSVGQKIPVNSNLWPQKDGGKVWAFDLVGVFDGKDEDTQRQTQHIYVNFSYFDEARQYGTGLAGMYISRLVNADDASKVSSVIDKMFENSADETKTMTDKEFILNFLKQLGDIGLIVNSILAAVFFTILLLTGNTMAQSVRERIPQFAVLKTLGFTDGRIAWMVLLETALLIAFGAAMGLGLANLISALVSADAPPVNLTVWAYAGIAVLSLALLVGLPPAIRAARLKIVDALAGR